MEFDIEKVYSVANNSYAGQLVDEIRLLKEQIEKMKCCFNCCHWNEQNGDCDCERLLNCEPDYVCDKWEMKE